MIEYRIKRFHELCNNKWYNVMNYVLDEMRIKCSKQKRMHIKYAKVFYF